jgi:hypothetical protein
MQVNDFARPIFQFFDMHLSVGEVHRYLYDMSKLPSPVSTNFNLVGPPLIEAVPPCLLCHGY